MLGTFGQLETLRKGDAHGERMVVKFTTRHAVDVYAVAVPQDGPSSTGPTWAYLFEHEGLNLIDPGAMGSFDDLADGIKVTGRSPADVDRLFVSHGHADHDGAVAHLVDASGAELWAHNAYARLLPHDPWAVQRDSGSPVQQYMHEVFDKYMREEGLDQSETGGRWRGHHDEYMTMRRGLTVNHPVEEGDRLGEMTIYHTPGHTPDSICVAFDGLLFTGDHVLPEITPHPSMKARLPGGNGSADASEGYGLATYLRSLSRVIEVGSEASMMPAHRLFNRGKFNLQTSERAREIIDHHSFRLRAIMRKIGESPTSLEALTRGIFSKHKLLGRNFYSALTEIVAHIEVLQDTDDLAWTDDRLLTATGSQNYWRFVLGLTSRRRR